VRRHLPDIPFAALAVPLALSWPALTGCALPPEDAAGGARSSEANQFELPPYSEAGSVLAELEKLDLSSVQRQAVAGLQAAMRQILVAQSLVYHWPMIVLGVREPAELRAGPSFQAPPVADLNVGSHVLTYFPFSTWVEIEVLQFPAHHSLLHREPGPPINWRGAGFVHKDRLEFDAAARSRFDREVFLSALAAFQESFVTAGSAGCQDARQACRQGDWPFECDLVMIVCIGKAFMGKLG
jgi:hypothetical protein